MADSARRPSGTPPYWESGSQIVWREGSGPLGTGPPVADPRAPHFANPMTVVRDDEDALVTRLAVGTPVMRLVRADGRDKRDDPASLFTAAVQPAIGVHGHYDQFRIAPTGRPWSVWVMFAAGTGRFAGWYVNLEKPHLRDDRSVYTSDHILDLVIDPDRSSTRKDEDELVLAVEQGVLTTAEAEQVEADAAEVEQLVDRWASPFRDGWHRFRPDPDWPTPGLTPS